MIDELMEARWHRLISATNNVYDEAPDLTPAEELKQDAWDRLYAEANQRWPKRVNPHSQHEAIMDRSIKLTQNGGEWLIERNGQAPEKLGADPGVARDQIVQFIDELLPDQSKPLAGPPAEPKTPADDADTTPTVKAKNDAPLTNKAKAA